MALRRWLNFWSASAEYRTLLQLKDGPNCKCVSWTDPRLSSLVGEIRGISPSKVAMEIVLLESGPMALSERNK